MACRAVQPEEACAEQLSSVEYAEHGVGGCGGLVQQAEVGGTAEYPLGAVAKHASL
jgi:hypothetical protein